MKSTVSATDGVLDEERRSHDPIGTRSRLETPYRLEQKVEVEVRASAPAAAKRGPGGVVSRHHPSAVPLPERK
jgi:hypothetical protein